MNIVATHHTRLVARDIILETRERGTDAVLKHLPRVHPEQSAALLVLLAQAAAHAVSVPRTDNPQRGGAAILSEVERRLAHRAYARGERDLATVLGEREYQRMRVRARRQAIA